MPAVWPIKLLKVDANWETSTSSTHPPAAKRPRVLPYKSDKASSVTSHLSAETPWTVADIAKAGCLLQTPQITVSFEDEEEMRRVYTLIFDVFRYKGVLNQTLRDAAFYIDHPAFAHQENVAELLLFDLHKRRFLPRSMQTDASRVELFRQANLTDIDATLFSAKTRLAASLSRIRISCQALDLGTLLPPHLRDGKIQSASDSFVTAWVNSFKSSDEPRRVIEQAGMRLARSSQEHLEPINFQLDPICPKFILCHPANRGDLIQSPLVHNNSVIMQDRAFCVGPAQLSRLLLELDLSGSIVQTHFYSPRSVAYLANIMADNDKIEAILAFGAAEKKDEYAAYLKMMGATKTQVFSERFVDIPPESALLDGVVAVLATPPNTYSAVTDPVDLACSRGGDLEMLRVLTDVASNTGNSERVEGILDEQRQTLRHSMSKPQIQVVLYETHSMLSSENEDMVLQMIDEMNRSARERHAEELGSRVTVQSAQSAQSMSGEATQDASKSTLISRPSFISNIKVPPCDLFEVGKLPTICLDADKKMEDEGFYLAVLQRKEIVRLDAKYMINIAESRGLFGDQGMETTTKKSRAQKKRAAMAAKRSGSRSGATLAKRHSRARRKIEVERIAAPTLASLQRQVHAQPVTHIDCPRHQQHNAECEAQEVCTDKSTSKRDEWSDNITTDMAVRNTWGRSLKEQAELVKRVSTPTQASIYHASIKRNANNMYDIHETDIPLTMNQNGPSCAQCRQRLMNAKLANEVVPPNTPSSIVTPVWIGDKWSSESDRDQQDSTLETGSWDWRRKSIRN